MELKVGMTFTGSEQCFTGRVEVLEIDKPNNRLRVGLTKKNETHTSNWNEDWDLQHTIWGFERGDYFVKNFTDYPQDLQRSTEQQCNIADVINSGDFEELPLGYRCPVCGNEVSLEESNYGEAILCMRCDNGEYTTMEPVWE